MGDPNIDPSRLLARWQIAVPTATGAPGPYICGVGQVAAELLAEGEVRHRRTVRHLSAAEVKRGLATGITGGLLTAPLALWGATGGHAEREQDATRRRRHLARMLAVRLDDRMER